MPHEHNFKDFPELRNSQMAEHYMQSPHKQIFESFPAKVTKVHDGDTISLETELRDFVFPLRLSEIDALELNEGGEDAKEWLEDQILEKDVYIKINPYNRVGKWGRLLGRVIFQGIDMNDELLWRGFAVDFDERDRGEFNLEKEMNIKNWLTPF